MICSWNNPSCFSQLSHSAKFPFNFLEKRAESIPDGPSGNRPLGMAGTNGEPVGRMSIYCGSELFGMHIATKTRDLQLDFSEIKEGQVCYGATGWSRQFRLAHFRVHKFIQSGSWVVIVGPVGN